MSKYLIKFKKEGVLRYISHLDLTRLFQRTMRRAGISLIHSQGFNPHPKMSFAQPLSLGFCSICEYLEIETTEDFPPGEIFEKINDLLPDGVYLTDCRKREPGGSSVSAGVAWGSYDIIWEDLPEKKMRDMAEALQEFLTQDRIVIRKQQKKKGVKEVDIRPMIGTFIYEGQENEKAVFSALVKTGSAANLNPELLMEALANFLQIPFAKENLSICRKGLYRQGMDGKPVPFMD